MFAALVLDRAVIRAAGPDARPFLNTLVTQELARLDQSPVTYAGLLSPQGKVTCDFLVWREGDGVLLDVPRARAADLVRRLSMYKLRAQVEIADISDRCAVYADLAAPGAPGAAPDPRLPALGWRRIGPAAPAGDAAPYRSHCLALGVPDLAEDAEPDEVFALEALFEELHGVAFDKGCFIGQENVSRMKRRATTRRKFCRLRVADPPAKGAPVLAAGVEIGDVRAAGSGTALALLRLDRALAAPEALTIEGFPAQLAPPDWLILPLPA
ncbi:MAG: folate-binding protein [Alphaproteobacteria bacterium]|nr:folate-binding protein [Alphaproteobacteria bacterium]